MTLDVGGNDTKSLVILSSEDKHECRLRNAGEPPVDMACLAARAILLLWDQQRGRGADSEDIEAAIATACWQLRNKVACEVPREGCLASLPVFTHGQTRRLREYIDQNIDATLRVVDLGRLVQRSQAHFSRSFKRTFGLSPHTYIMRRRVELAAMLMVASDSSLSQIAIQCGFCDQPHFCRHFRRVTGLSPAAWRREAHNGRTFKPPAVKTRPAV